MNKADVLSIAREQLSDAICQDQPPICDPLKVSPWIAMSWMHAGAVAGEQSLRGHFEIGYQACSSSSKTFASFRSSVSKPSVNQP